jgi:hypothetical protein
MNDPIVATVVCAFWCHAALFRPSMSAMNFFPQAKEFKRYLFQPKNQFNLSPWE